MNQLDLIRLIMSEDFRGIQEEEKVEKCQKCDHFLSEHIWSSRIILDLTYPLERYCLTEKCLCGKD